MGKKEKHRTGKWKYGSVSALMLVMVLAALIALNIGIYALEKNKGWGVDFSFNGILSQSAETKEVLEKLENPVEIYGLFRRSEEREFSGPIVEIEGLLDKYAASSDLVTWKQVDPTLDPALVQRFTTDKVTPVENNLIISCEKTGRFRVVGGDDLMGQGYDEEAGYYVYNNLTYERAITSAIAYVVQERVPRAVILQGHEELTEDELYYFQRLLELNQYEVAYEDLKDSSYTPDAKDLLIFFRPKKDLNERELKLLADFEAKGGHFLFACDYLYQQRDLPNYNTLLRSFGFIPKNGMVTADVNAADTYDQYVFCLKPEICSTDMTFSMVAQGIREIILNQAIAFEEPEEADRNLSIEVVLRSGETSVLKDSEKGNQTGAFPLAMQARRVTAEGYVSRAVVIGDCDILTDGTMYSQTYNQEFTISVMDFLLDPDGASARIAAKEISRPGLKTASAGLGSILLIALPLSVLFAALLVLGPRKNA